ncbi:tudor domain-containing protein 7 isoform X2 [Uranotaenia lowii]|uniref:tudor domain-containing protein 7 isoform X2 n=1 Tax=Uranotaenia lowii TaxID=190385 RepID=UPI00247864A8|nr:tudor domain-containing protein 7 isoform X2 [Uranotaenia lowii]
MANSGQRKFTEEAEAAISVLRALVASQKGPSTVRGLLRDYRELEGGQLMYKKFGFPNADEFLKASGEFMVQSNNMSETIVYVKPSKDSAHILKMVAAQKSTKPRKSGFAVPRQPQRRIGEFNWNPSAYNKIYSQMPNKINRFPQNRYTPQTQYVQQQRFNTPKTYNQNTFNRNSYNNNNVTKPLNNYSQPKPLMSQKIAPPQHYNANDNSNNNQQTNQRYNTRSETNNNNTSAKNLNKPAQIPSKTSPGINDFQSKDKPQQKKDFGYEPPTTNAVSLQPPARSVNSRLQVTRSFANTTQITMPEPVEKLPLKSTQSSELHLPSALTPPSTPPVASSLPGKISLQDRLKMNQQVDPTDLEKVSRVLTPQASPIKSNHKVNGSTYSTYPDDYANEFEGQFAAAQNAIDAIKREEDRNNFSVSLDSDYEIATKIYNLLVNCPHGMFWKNIPEAFRKVHNVLLPDHWESIVLTNANMFVKEETETNTIVFANELADDNGDVTSEAASMSANVLKLPWHEQYWNIYITNPASTVEIWARLVGPQFSDQMDTLITDIEMSMLGAHQPKPEKLAVGEYYLVSMVDCWYRVRVEEADFVSSTCVCFFIDIGEWEKVSFDDVYLCDAKWLELPGQSVCFSLDGLEDFGENPKAKIHLDNLISGKVCIGEILTTKEEYEKDDDDVRIRMILYDTSSEEDVNLNSVILKNVCEDTPVPELNRKGVTTVTITHVDDSGFVYCRLKDAGMVYIQKLINNLVQSDALESKHRGLYRGKTGNQLYLVQDERDKKWYRASLIAEEGTTVCKMFYVDMGIKQSVNLSNVYRLEMLSVALSRYPAQAILVKMFDIPDVNDYLLSRLRALLKTGLIAMVKVAAFSSIPLVKIYMHLDQNKILVCVNDSIRSEMELEINSEVISDPRIYSAAMTESSNSSHASSKFNGSFNSDYSLKSEEAADLSNYFSALSIEQGKKRNNGGSTRVIPKLAKFTLPKVGEQFDVCVTMAASPNYFIVQPYAQANQLNSMMIEFQDYCNNKKPQMVPKESVQQGEAYAMLNSADGNWYRVLVVNILIGPALIHVYFCDFGQVRIVESESLRVLPQHLRILPQQAMKARLHGVQPVAGDWDTPDALRFKELTEGKKFVSFVRSVQVDEFNPNDDIVDLTLIDVSTENDIYIHQIMVDEKRGVLSSK